MQIQMGGRVASAARCYQRSSQSQTSNFKMIFLDSTLPYFQFIYLNVDLLTSIRLPDCSEHNRLYLATHLWPDVQDTCQRIFAPLQPPTACLNIDRVQDTWLVIRHMLISRIWRYELSAAFRIHTHTFSVFRRHTDKIVSLYNEASLIRGDNWLINHLVLPLRSVINIWKCTFMMWSCIFCLFLN